MSLCSPHLPQASFLHPVRRAWPSPTLVKHPFVCVILPFPPLVRGMYWVSFEQKWTWQPAASGGGVSWTVFVCPPFSACVFYLKWSVIVCSLTRWWIINSSVCLCGSAGGGRSGDWKVTLSSAQDLAVLFSPSHQCLKGSLQKCHTGKPDFLHVIGYFQVWNTILRKCHTWIRIFACENKTWQSEITWNLLRHKRIPKCSPANVYFAKMSFETCLFHLIEYMTCDWLWTKMSTCENTTMPHFQTDLLFPRINKNIHATNLHWHMWITYVSLCLTFLFTCGSEIPPLELKHGKWNPATFTLSHVNPTFSHLEITISHG